MATAATVNYGVFINNVIDFLLRGFLRVKQVNRFMPKLAEPPPVAAKECDIANPIQKAPTRGPHRTSELPPG